MNCIAILLFKYRFHGRSPDCVRSWQVWFAQAKIDASRHGSVKDLPDHALIYPAQSLRRLKLLQRRKSSNCTAVSVFSSLYFTITGAYSDNPHSFALSLFTVRDPGTTTAPEGISSGVRSDLRYISSRTRSKTGVEAVRIVPAANTARSLTIVPSYTPQFPPIKTSYSMMT